MTVEDIKNLIIKLMIESDKKSELVNMYITIIEKLEEKFSNGETPKELQSYKDKTIALSQALTRNEKNTVIMCEKFLKEGD